jgi:hypothetical protein
MTIAWVASAKKEETRVKRLSQLIEYSAESKNQAHVERSSRPALVLFCGNQSHSASEGLPPQAR